MKLLWLVILSALTVTFVICSLWNGPDDSVERKKSASPDSGMIAIIEKQPAIGKVEETLPLASLKGRADPQGISSPQSTMAKVKVESKSTVGGAGSTTFASGRHRKQPNGLGALKRVVKSGFPDIEVQVDPDMMKEVSSRYRLQLAVACYRDSLLKFVALVKNPFGNPKLSTDLSSLPSFSSRPRSDELPLDVAARIRVVAEEKNLWANGYFLCWLVPASVEEIIMNLQKQAVESANLRTNDVTKTIGFYDGSLSIHISALETKWLKTIVIEK